MTDKLEEMAERFMGSVDVNYETTTDLFYKGYLPIFDKKEEGLPFFRRLKPEQVVKAIQYLGGQRATCKLMRMHLSYAVGDSGLKFSSEQVEKLLDAFIKTRV